MGHRALHSNRAHGGFLITNLPIIEWSPDRCLFVTAEGAVEYAPTVGAALDRLGRPKKVALALSRRQVFTKTVRLPNVAAEEAKALLRFRLEEYFPLPANELAYDVHFSDDVDSEGRLANVFACKGETMREAKALFQKSGATIEAAIPISLGSLGLGFGPGPVAVVSSAAEGIGIDLLHNDLVLASRTTSDSASPSEVEAEVARSMAAAGVAGETQVYQPIQELVPHARSFAAHPLAVLASNRPGVNLRLPEDLAREANKKVMARRRLAVLLICAAVCVGAISYLDRDDAARAARAEREKTERMTKELNSRKSLIAAESSKLSSATTIVVDGLDPRQALSDVILVAVNSAPPNLWLTGINVERGKDVNIRGTAKSNEAVSAYSDALSSSSRLRDVNLVFSNNNTIGDTPVVQFSITAHVTGNLPLVEPKKERSSRR